MKKVFLHEKEYDQQHLEVGGKLAGVKGWSREVRGRIKQIGGGLILKSLSQTEGFVLFATEGH